MKAKTRLEYILAYLLWAVTLGLGAWLAFTSRNTLEEYLGKYFIKEENQFMLTKQAIFLDIVIPVLLWLLWFVMLIVVEEYYRRGVEKHSLIRRFMKVVGILFVLMFINDLLLNLMLGFAAAGWLRWLLTLIELLVGVALSVASRLRPTVQSDQTPTTRKN